ncbi:MAG: HEAT repeat domain-containing protein [Planctomycetes bacterium]|nr:HEAT repeat domain-containing protein [Planctomycetota bacterium]
MNDFVRKYLVIALVMAFAACSVGYGIWAALNTREAGLKEDADKLAAQDESVRKAARERLLNAGIRSINPLLRAVKLGDLDLRIAATELLGEVGRRDQERLVDANIEKVVKTLAEEIAKESPSGGFVIVSPSHEMRVRVARALGQYSSEASVELLLVLLDDKEQDVRLAARDSLVSAGIRGSRVLARRLADKKRGKNPLLANAVDALVQNIVKDVLDKNAYGDVRMRAARALRDLGGSRIENAKGMVELMLNEDGELRLRKVAADVVPDIAPDRLRPLAPELKKGLEKDEEGAISIKNGTIALGVAKSLARIGEPEGMEYVIECLENGDAMVRLSAAEALNELGVKAKKEIIKNLDNPAAMVRGPVLRVLPDVEARPEAEKELMEGLDDTDGDVRTAAAIGLGRMGDDDAIPKLISRLDDRRSRVRHYAEWAVQDMGPAAKPYLEATLASRTDWPCESFVAVVSDMVIDAFKRRGLATRKDAVDEAILEELEFRRMNLPTPWAVRVVVKGENGKDLAPLILDVREVFVFLTTLSRMTGVPQERLLFMGRDVVECLERRGIRFQMFDQLDPSLKKGPKNVVPLQYSSFYMIAGMLGILGDKGSVPALLNALESGDLDLLSPAAWAIGMIADRTAGPLPEEEKIVEKFMDLALNSKPGANDPTAVKTAHMLVREKSVEALGKIADPKAKPTLQNILVCDDQGRVRTAASIAIAKIDGGERRILFDQYVDILDHHEDQSVRTAATKKIGELGSFEARNLLLGLIRKEKEYAPVLDAAEAALKTLTGKDYSKEVTAKRLDVPKEEEKTEESKKAEETKKTKDLNAPVASTPKASKSVPPKPAGKPKGKAIPPKGSSKKSNQPAAPGP